MDEQVFVVRRADCFGGSWPQGVRQTGCEATAAEFLQRGFFVDRAPAEADPSLKQVIPYCVITRAGDDAMLVVQRRRSGNENRLHGLYSIGLGGHVSPEDGDPSDSNFLAQALLRELHEELFLPEVDPSTLLLAGLVNDDSNPVGRVHVGLVYRLQIPAETAPEVAIREIRKLHGGFTPLVELRSLWQDPYRFEGWSRLVLEALCNLPRQGEVPTSTESE